MSSWTQPIDLCCTYYRCYAGDHTGVWTSTKTTVAASAAIPAAYSGAPYAWNDMDMVR